MNEREQIAWLARRAGFGPAPGQLDAGVELGVDAVLDALVDPDANGVDPAPDPFVGIERDRDGGGQALRETILAWVRHAMTTPRPLEARLQFFWHDFFAVSARAVNSPGYIHDHMNLLARHSMGNFGDLLRDVTTDAAMLIFLNGTQSTGANPNENYGRELLELYSVGVGNFDEDDVRAAAVALTGWFVARRFGGEVRLGVRRHDDTPQTLLGVAGVHDVDTVVDAVLAHPATAPRITRLLAQHLLGPAVDQSLVDDLAESFAGDYELQPLVRSLLEAGVDGFATEAIVEPVPWFAGAIRATGAQPEGRRIAESFGATGQVPLLPPNVGGFPPAMSYLSTSATVARFNLASSLAASTPPPSPAMTLAAAGDNAGLADLFGLVNGFSAATTAALDATTSATDRLAAALAAPDLIIS